MWPFQRFATPAVDCVARSREDPLDPFLMTGYRARRERILRLSANPSKYSDIGRCNSYFMAYAKFLPDGISQRPRAEKSCRRQSSLPIDEAPFRRDRAASALRSWRGRTMPRGGGGAA